MDDFLKQFPAIIKEAAQSILGVFALIILLFSVICLIFFHNAPMGIRIGIFIFISFGFGLFIYALYLKLPPTAPQDRLLTEKEWQAAAAGKEGREYAWGNEWDKNKCNNRELKIEACRAHSPNGPSFMWAYHGKQLGSISVPG